MPGPANSSLLWIIVAPVLLVVLFCIVLAWLAGVGKGPLGEKWRDVFYRDSENPSFLVSKRRGVGYTLNFANRWSWSFWFLLF